MKSVLIFILMSFSVTYAQIQKELTFVEEISMQFELFKLLKFTDENNSKWYVFSPNIYVDSSCFGNYKSLKPLEKYLLELYKVEYYNMPYACILSANCSYILDDDLIISNNNPIKDSYFTSSLVGGYYIECK